MKKNLSSVFALIFLFSALAFAYDRDQEISNDISAAVARADIPKPYTLNVEVEDGKVVLKGQVV
ncbi:MAG: BON domain-containing protein, partial [SAR324 cluster bacterium]|nr:BON domain-containing protein [SAR324 cluster bacterium]